MLGRYFVLIIVSLFSFQMLTAQEVKLNWSEKITGNFDFASKSRSIKCEVSTYEYFDCDQIMVKKNGNVIHFETIPNASTHAILSFSLKNDYIVGAKISLNSIIYGQKKVYKLKSGLFKIDKEAFKKNIIKANFNFDFGNFEGSTKKMFWKGLIYSSISNSK